MHVVNIRLVLAEDQDLHLPALTRIVTLHCSDNSQHVCAVGWSYPAWLNGKAPGVVSSAST